MQTYERSPTMKKVVLVYSGGLDTSICIPLMREEYGYERVITVTVDVGQPEADIRDAAEKAKAMGTEHYTIDAKEEFAKEYCFAAVRANGYYEGYPLSTSIARPIIAAKAVEVAKKLGATAFAHGCTGKGNDQFRIEFSIRALMPEATIHAPIRERNLTRTWEIEYAKTHGVPIKQSLEKIWSIDENLWGRSIEGGRLEEPDFFPPEEIFQWTRSPIEAPNFAQEIEVDFENGVPVAIGKTKLSPAALIAKANALAGENGVGRIDIMEDRMLGLKVRENYECPGATLLLTAHRALEALVLTREELRFKASVDAEWGRLAYEGLWYDPFKDALEAFIAKTQTRVTGTVFLRLFKGSVQVAGRKSAWALYSENLASFDTTAFDQRESTGTVKNFGLQQQMYFQLSQNLRKSQ
ncbi:MAG: argininosuccinate synthase [Bdellovibrionota bacterium]